MQVKDIKSVKPRKNKVVATVKAVNKDDGFYEGEADDSGEKIEMYHAEVISMGPDANKEGHCPGLEVGETVAFSKFAGYHIATRDQLKNKVLEGYDIMAILDDPDNLNPDTIRPTADRLLVAVIDEECEEDGLYSSNSNKKDPRTQDITYAKVVRLGPSVKETKIGDIVAFSPYVGETIRYQLSALEPELKSIIEDAIAFVV